jgi:membrane-associated phospholipid phosphatase
VVHAGGLALSASTLDRWTLGYLAFTSALVVASRRPGAAVMLLAHAILAGLTLAAPALRRRGGAFAFVGEFYPLMATVVLYTVVGLVNSAARVSHDAAVQAWEQALFGGQPSHDWIRAAPWPWLSWLLHGGYLSYYFILAGAPLALWLSGRRDGARRAALATMVTFYICYVTFLLFPVAGPRYLFPHARNAATETAIARFVQGLLERGAAWGTAFPSSHVAASLAAAGTTLSEWRPLGVVLLAAAGVLTLGTVYGQFHYAVDAVAGAALAGVVVAAARANAN